MYLVRNGAGQKVTRPGGEHLKRLAETDRESAGPPSSLPDAVALAHDQSGHGARQSDTDGEKTRKGTD
jgi:hypothetical protein